MNYKIWDKVRILADNCNHQLKIGSIQTIENKRNSTFSGLKTYQLIGLDVYVCEKDIEPYKTNQNGNIINKGKEFNFK